MGSFNIAFRRWVRLDGACIVQGHAKRSGRGMSYSLGSTFIEPAEERGYVFTIDDDSQWTMAGRPVHHVFDWPYK